MLPENKTTTLRRRTVDKMCKNPNFLKQVLGLAIEQGAINYSDIITAEEAKTILNYKKDN